MKRYAKDVYNKPQQILNWKEDIDVSEVPIRIKLYLFEEICKLVSSSNEVFFKLLKNELKAIGSEGK